MVFRCRRRQRPFLILAPLLFGLIGLIGVTTVSAQATSLSLEAYWQELAAIQAELNSLQAEPEAAQPPGRLQLANRLRAIKSVVLADGRTVSLDHTFLIQQLGNENVSLTTIEAYLDTLLAGRNEWPDPRFDPLDEATLTQILSRPEFQYEVEEPNILQRWWEDFRLRLRQFLLDLLPTGETGNFLGNVITILGAVALAVVLAYALRGLVADFTAEAQVRPDDHLHDEDLTAETALKRAQEYSGGGDYRTAVRYLYLSSLLLLEERDLLRYDRSLTNREYLRSLAHRPELAQILREVIDVFDRVWYGFQPLNAREYEQYADRVEILNSKRSRS